MLTITTANWFSVILQGFVDSSYRLIDIYVGWPAKVHDARVFANSSIYIKGENGDLIPNNTTKTFWSGHSTGAPWRCSITFAALTNEALF